MDDLTPIRVRGARHGPKRRTPFNKGPLASKRRRIMVADPVGDGLTIPSTTISRSSLKLSSLELLPLEILEAIFMYTPTTDLPSSSPILGKVLSSERMFNNSAATWLLRQGTTQTDDGADTDAESMASTQVFMILRCRWMTWFRFQAIITLLASQSVTDDEQPTLDFSRPWRQTQMPFLRLNSNVHLPEKLLRGPWSADKSQFLYYLCWLGLRADWDNSTAGETASTGLEDAIRARDRRAVAALVSDQVMVLPTSDNLRAAIMQHGCDETIVFHLLSSCLRAKSRERNGTAQYGTLNANPLDPVIWSWLKRFESSGNSKAVWLRRALREAASMMNDTSSTMLQQSEEFKASCDRESALEELPVPTWPSPST